jgi:hypothetical protein
MSVASEWGVVPEFAEQKQKPTQFERFDLDDLMAFNPAADPNNLIGNRWLCRGMAGMIFSAAGKGKSSLRGDMSVAWALGQSWNGLKPVRPLRVVVLQGENDSGDEAEILQGVLHSRNGGATELAALQKNLLIFRLPCITGPIFCKHLATFLQETPCDLVWIDPLFHIAGRELGMGGDISGFLREHLEPIMRETGVAVLWNHHSTKVRDKAAKADLDWSAMFHGSVEILNFVRAAAALIPSDTHPGVAEFRCIKRERRTGFVDEAGEWIQSIWLEQAAGGQIGWRQIQPPDGADPAPAATKDKLLAYAAARRKACTSATELPNKCAEVLAAKFGCTSRAIYDWEKVHRAIVLEAFKYQKNH